MGLVYLPLPLCSLAKLSSGDGKEQDQVIPQGLQTLKLTQDLYNVTPDLCFIDHYISLTHPEP